MVLSRIVGSLASYRFLVFRTEILPPPCRPGKQSNRYQSNSKHCCHPGQAARRRGADPGSAAALCSVGSRLSAI